MKTKRKTKRIFSVALCMLMLLTALPITAVTANAAAQAYIKYIDTEVYIGDVLNIIVGVNGGSTDETFTYQWQAKYPSRNWTNLSDKTDNPDSKFSGVFTDHLKFQTHAGLAEPGSGWKDVIFRCKVTGSKSGTFYSGSCNFPGLLEKTKISVIAFFDLEEPEQGNIPSTTATPGNTAYYTFDHIEWYKRNRESSDRKLDSGEAFDSGTYYCHLYFNMNRGYDVSEKAVCGLYNGDQDDKILKDDVTGQYYILAYYTVLNEKPIITNQTDKAYVVKGESENLTVSAENAVSFQWQIRAKVSTNTGVTRYMWLNISDSSTSRYLFSYTGTDKECLTIVPNRDFDDTDFRCVVTGKKGDVVYSKKITVQQKVQAKIVVKLKSGGSPSDKTCVQIDEYTKDNVFVRSRISYPDEKYAQTAYCYFETGRYVITVSKPQCVTRVYEVNINKKDVTLDVNITIPYDVNLDGDVNIMDATVIQKNIVNLLELDSYQKELADANGDGIISVTDATIIQKKIVNLL